MAAPSIFSFFKSFIPGLRLIDGGELATLVDNTLSASSTITALAGGGATGAPVLGSVTNEITVCATNNDSVQLPIAIQGLYINVVNSGAATLAVFPNQANPNNASNAGDQIIPHNSVAPGAAGASTTIAVNIVTTFFAVRNGVWKAANYA